MVFVGDTALSFTLARDGNKAGELPNFDNVVIGAALQANRSRRGRLDRLLGVPEIAGKFAEGFNCHRITVVIPMRLGRVASTLPGWSGACRTSIDKLRRLTNCVGTSPARRTLNDHTYFGRKSWVVEFYSGCWVFLFRLSFYLP
jgi:hypothetical protein